MISLRVFNRKRGAGLHSAISFDIEILSKIEHAMDKLKHRPRKSLGYRTPYEVFFKTKTSLTVALGSCIQELLSYHFSEFWLVVMTALFKKFCHADNIIFHCFGGRVFVAGF